MTSFIQTQDSTTDIRRLGDIANELKEGKVDTVGNITLTANSTSTQVTDRRCGVKSVVHLTPKTANAAAVVSSIYIVPTANSFTINHNSSSNTDMTFHYAILG